MKLPSFIRRRFGCTGLRLRLWKRTQVELWYAPRGTVIPPHTHPHIVSRLTFLLGRMRWRAGDRESEFGVLDCGRTFAVPPDCVHGATTTGRFGLFLNFERWVPGVPMTSAAEDLQLA